MKKKDKIYEALEKIQETMGGNEFFISYIDKNHEGAAAMVGDPNKIGSATMQTILNNIDSDDPVMKAQAKGLYMCVMSTALNIIINREESADEFFAIYNDALRDANKIKKSSGKIISMNPKDVN